VPGPHAIMRRMRSRTAGRFAVYALAVLGLLTLLLHAPHEFVPRQAGEAEGVHSCPVCAVAHTGAVLTPLPSVTLDLPREGVRGVPKREGRVQSPASPPSDSRGPPIPAI
jgi:hypothetical protein